MGNHVLVGPKSTVEGVGSPVPTIEEGVGKNDFVGNLVSVGLNEVVGYHVAVGSSSKAGDIVFVND